MLKTFKNQLFSLSVYGTPEIPYFKGAEVAKILGYQKPEKAIMMHVEAEDKITFTDLLKNVNPPNRGDSKLHPKTIFINESGLYSLILSSKLPSAKQFKRWVTSEVLPSIRKSGEYKLNKNVKSILTFNLQTEADLQKIVVNYLRTKHPGIRFVATLGENQDTEEKRIKSYMLGYTAGSPDLLIFYKNKLYSGLAIELKTPKGTGSLSAVQEQFLIDLQKQKWDVLVSNDLLEIIDRICRHITCNPIQLPKRRRKESIPVKNRATILDFVQDVTEDDLEEFNMEGVIQNLEDEGEFDLADGIRSHLS